MFGEDLNDAERWVCYNLTYTDLSRRWIPVTLQKAVFHPVSESRSPMPKYLELSRLLESRLSQGIWTEGKIPTVREIAEQHRVSVLTASRALQVLQGKGLIHTVERSGCYVVPSRIERGERYGLLWRISPGAWQPASAAVVQKGFDAVASEQGVSFDSAVLELRDSTSESEIRRQVRSMLSNGFGGLFFLPSRISDAMVAQDELVLDICRQERLPVVLIDRNLRGSDRPLEHDLVSSDHVDGGRRSTDHLLALGRRRIVCVIGSPTSSHIDREAGYLYALNAASRTLGEPLPAHVLSVPQDVSSREAFGWLTDQLLAYNADGVLCYQDYTAVGLILELFRRGVRVPADLAVVGCDNLPIGHTFSVGVTTYAYPSEELARQALRLLRERIAFPNRPPVKVVVPGKLIIRDSTVHEEDDRNGHSDHNGHNGHHGHCA